MVPPSPLSLYLSLIHNSHPKLSCTHHFGQQLSQRHSQPLVASTMSFSMPNSHLHGHSPKLGKPLLPNTATLTKFGGSSLNAGLSLQMAGKRSEVQRHWRVHAFPDWHSVANIPPLMAVMIEHVAGQRDYVVHKSLWHLNDDTMKNIYTMYIMFTVWGCCFFGSTKDPFYDGEQYRKDGGDGTVHWIYEKQEDIEEAARAELWREELIEEIELKVGGLRELQEASKEELVK